MLIVILRRILLVSILAGPQWFWINEALSLTRRLKLRGIRWLANVFLFLAVIVMALVLFDRVAMRGLPQWLGGAVASMVQLWIISSTVACLCVLSLRILAWLLIQLRSMFVHAEQ